MKKTSIWFLVVSVFSFIAVGLTGGPARAGDTSRVPPSPRLELHALKDKKGVEGYELTAYIKAKPEAVWEIIADTAKVHEIFPDVRARLIRKEKSGNPNVTKILWHYTIATSIGDKVFDLRVEEDHQAGTMKWERVSGDLAAFEGNGKVSACPNYPEYAKLEYNHFVNAGGMTPQFLTNRSNKHDLLQLVPNLEKLLDLRPR